MKNKKSPYLEDINEWQTKQYMPGYYVGSKIFPVFKSGSFFIPITLISWGMIMFFMGVFLLFFGRQHDTQQTVFINSAELVLAGVFAGAIGAVWFATLLKKKRV